MILEHVAIWTGDLELMKDFYCRTFGAKAGARYENPEKQFQSYFLTFESGARLELMKMKDIPENLNDTIQRQHQGIIHLAFGVNTRDEVDAMASQLKSRGYRIVSGPRETGDGYYEFEMLDPENNRLEVTTK